MITDPRSFGRLSKRLQAAWVAVVLSGIALLAASTRYRAKDTVDTLGQRLEALRLDSEQRHTSLTRQHDELLAEIRDLSMLRAGTLRFPTSDTDSKIDGVVIILDMTGARSLDDPKAAEAAKVLTVVDGPNSLVTLVREGKVAINELRLVKRDLNSGKGGTEANYQVNLSLQNMTDKEITVNVPKGQVFENTEAGSGFQNLATADEVNIKLGPHELKPEIRAYCINHGRKEPVNQPGYLTPMKLKVAAKDQIELWRIIGEKLPAAGRR